MENGIGEGEKHARFIAEIGAAWIAMVASEGVETGPKGGDQEAVGSGDSHAIDGKGGRAFANNWNLVVVGEAEGAARGRAEGSGVKIMVVFKEVVGGARVSDGMRFGHGWRGRTGRRIKASDG